MKLALRKAERAKNTNQRGHSVEEKIMPIRDYTNSPREGHGLKIQCPYLESEDLKSEKRNRVIGNLKRKEDYLESRLRSSPGAQAAGAGRR